MKTIQLLMIALVVFGFAFATVGLSAAPVAADEVSDDNCKKDPILDPCVDRCIGDPTLPWCDDDGSGSGN